MFSDGIFLSTPHISLTPFSKFSYRESMNIHPGCPAHPIPWADFAMDLSGRSWAVSASPGVAHAEELGPIPAAQQHNRVLSLNALLLFPRSSAVVAFLFLIWLLSSQSLFSTVLQRSTFAIFQARFLAFLGLAVSA